MKVLSIVLGICLVILTIFLLPVIHDVGDAQLTVAYEIKTSIPLRLQTFYTTTPSQDFQENKSSVFTINRQADAFQRVEFQIQEPLVRRLRFDFGSEPSTVTVRNVTITSGKDKIDLTQLLPGFSASDCVVNEVNGELIVKSMGNDPFIWRDYDFPVGMVRKTSWRIYLPILAFTILLVAQMAFKGWKWVQHNPREMLSLPLLVVCTVLILPSFLFRERFDWKSENRSAASKPDKLLSAGRLNTKFPQQFENWFNDRFKYRQKMIHIHSKIMYLLAERIPPNRNVMVGKKHWLFYTSKEDGNSIARFQQTIPYTNDQLVQIQNNLVGLYNYYAEHGIEYYFIAPPAKSTIYGEFYPDHIKQVGAVSNLDQILKHMREHSPEVPIVDVRQALFENKAKAELFMQADTHWNNYGAFIGYQELLKIIQENRRYRFHIPTEEDFNITKFLTSEQDLTNMIGIKMKYFKGEGFNYSFKLRDSSQKEMFIVRDTKSGKAIHAGLFNDSFGDFMKPFLSISFPGIHTIEHANFIKEGFELPIKEDMSIDIVIHEFTERLFDGLANQAIFETSN